MDLSYFEEPVEVLVTEEVGHRDETTFEWVVDSPAVYETQQQIRRRCQAVSHSDLTRIISKQLNSIRLDAKILLQQETVQWDWFDRYQDHLARVEEIEAWNELNAGVFDEGTEDEVVVAPRELPVAPVRPPTISAVQWRENNYRVLRQASYGSWQEQIETIIDDMRNGTSNAVAKDDAVRTKHSKPI